MLLYLLLIYFTRVNNLNFYNIKTIKKFYNYNNLNYDIYNDITSNKLTAEHIFPKYYTKMYTNCKYDMHNIFLTNSITNSYRSNYKFSNESFINNLLYDSSKNYKNHKYKIFIPSYKSRGIISRSIKYMLYNYDKLLLEDIIDEYTLNYWDYKYPPTQFEYKKNRLIKYLQGNYNIFIN